MHLCDVIEIYTETWPSAPEEQGLSEKLRVTPAGFNSRPPVCEDEEEAAGRGTRARRTLRLLDFVLRFKEGDLRI